MGRLFTVFLLVLILADPAYSQPTACGVAESSGTLEQVRKILREALAGAEQAEDAPTKHLVLTPIAAAYARAGEAEAAVEMSGEFHKPSERFPILAAIVREQARFGDVPGALRTAELIEDDKLRVVAWQIVAYAQAVVGDTVGGLRTAHAIPDEYAQTKSEALVLVGYWQGILGDSTGAWTTLDQAESLVESMPPGLVKVKALLRVAGTRAAVGDGLGPVRVFQRALELASALEDKNEKKMSLYRIGRAQVAAEDFEGAMRTAEQIEDDRFQDGVLGAMVAVQAPIRHLDRLEAAFRIVSLMRTDSSRDMALAQLAQEQVYAESPEAALETVAGIRDKAFRDRVRESVLAAANRNPVEPFTECLEESPEGIRVNPGCPDEQLAHVYFRLARQGAYDGARESARAIRDLSSKSQAYRTIGSIQARAGRWEEALVWARGETSPTLKAYALLGIAGGMLSCLKPEKIAAPPATTKQ